MDHADGDDGLAGGATLLQHRQEVQGDIRVAGQAQLARPLGMPRHQLGHRVDALGVDVAGDVAVVATDVVLLRRRTVQQAAGLQVELLDADVRRQFVAAQGVQVIQLRVVGEDPFGERLEETPLQVAASGGRPRESAVYSVSWRSGRVRRRWYNALTSRLGLPSPRAGPCGSGPQWSAASDRLRRRWNRFGSRRCPPANG